MHERKRVSFLILIMVVISAFVAMITITLLYQAALEEQRDRLVETAQSQARLIEAIARHDAIYEQGTPGGAEAATMSQLIDAHENYKGFGETGEFTLARREGDSIVFLLSHRHYDLTYPKPVPFDSELAEPMRQALSGNSGALVGLDYRGEKVLAAYEPVAVLDLGIVAKIDLSEIQAPFVRAGMIAGLSSLVVVMLGSILFLRLSNPMIRRLRESEESYHAIFTEARDGIVLIDRETSLIINCNPEFESQTGRQLEQLKKMKIWEVRPPEKIEATQKKFFEITREGKGGSSELEFQKPDGEIISIEFVATTVTIQGRDYLQSITRDITERKRAEKRIGELSYALERSPVTIIIADVKGNIEYVNTKFTEITGYTREEVMGKNPSILKSETTSPEEYKKLWGTITSGREWQGEFLNKRKDGELYWESATITPIKNSDGVITHFIAAKEDITERKQMEEALRESENRYRTLFDSSSDAIFIHDLEGRFLDVNQVACERLGYSREELLQMMVQDIDSPEYASQLLQRSSDIVEEGHVTVVTEQVRRDGTIIPTEVSSRMIEYGGRLAVIASARDITEREQMENLKKEKVRLETEIVERKRAEQVLHDIATGVSAVTGEAFFHSLVQYLARMLGMDYAFISELMEEKEEKAKTIAVSAHGEIVENFEYELANTPCENIVGQGLCAYPRDIRQQFPQDHLLVEMGAESYVGIPLFSSAGRALGLIAVMDGKPMSNTNRAKAMLRIFAARAAAELERKRAEKKIVEYEEMDKLKGNLLSMVSHELRTPLATIKGYSTMLLDYDRRLKSDEKREHLESIDRATDRLTELVDHLLDLSRLEAGLIKLEKTPTSISKLAREVVAEAKLRAPKHKIMLRLRKRLPTVNIDTRRIRQVLDNIIDNAVKYSKERTEIVISAERAGQELIVSVSDEGIGIPAEELERVFDRMYRIEQRRTPRIGGAGLGLAICKGLVEAHDGRIWMESEEGKGSTCFFTLPL